ncbi:MAG: PAS domain-containing protein [Myxococcales bacterium]|nr:PAS domain-containing protein [Myxococcales bacterium]
MPPVEPASAPLRAPSIEGAVRATSPVLLTFRVEPDGRRSMPYAAQAIVDIYGLCPGLLRDDATPALELIHPDDAAAVSATIDESARSLTPWECTFRVRHPTKGILWIEGRSIPAKEPDGAVVWHGFIHDVTARLQAETALRVSEMKFRELAENIEDVFWLTDPSKTKLEYISPAYERVWGRSCESLYRDPMQWLEAIHPDDRARIQAAAVAQAVNSYDVEYRIVVPDGSVKWVRDRAFPVHDESGAIVRIAGLAQDVTEKRELEEQLRLTQRMESIGRLAGGVAHDFNNLLTVISACSEEVVASLPPGSPQHEALCEVRVAVDRAAGLTRDLLAFSRREVLTPQALELNVVVTDTQRMLRRILGENIDLVTSLDPGAGWVFVDPGHWSSVVLNLAVNARDATGYTDDEVVRYGVSREEVSLLRKPFTIQALVDKVREVLAG